MAVGRDAVEECEPDKQRMRKRVRFLLSLHYCYLLTLCYVHAIMIVAEETQRRYRQEMIDRNTYLKLYGQIVEQKRLRKAVLNAGEQEAMRIRREHSGTFQEKLEAICQMWIPFNKQVAHIDETVENLYKQI